MVFYICKTLEHLVPAHLSVRNCLKLVVVSYSIKKIISLSVIVSFAHTQLVTMDGYYFQP